MNRIIKICFILSVLFISLIYRGPVARAEEALENPPGEFDFIEVYFPSSSIYNLNSTQNNDFQDFPLEFKHSDLWGVGFGFGSGEGADEVTSRLNVWHSSNIINDGGGSSTTLYFTGISIDCNMILFEFPRTKIYGELGFPLANWIAADGKPLYRSGILAQPSFISYMENPDNYHWINLLNFCCSLFDIGNRIYNNHELGLGLTYELAPRLQIDFRCAYSKYTFFQLDSDIFSGEYDIDKTYVTHNFRVNVGVIFK